MATRPWDNAARPWQRVYRSQRLSMRAAILVGASVTAVLWLGITLAAIRLFS